MCTPHTYAHILHVWPANQFITRFLFFCDEMCTTRKLYFFRVTWKLYVWHRFYQLPPTQSKLKRQRNKKKDSVKGERRLSLQKKKSGLHVHVSLVSWVTMWSKEGGWFLGSLEVVQDTLKNDLCYEFTKKKKKIRRISSHTVKMISGKPQTA